MAAGGWPITFSVGAAAFHVPHGSLDEMLRVVDALMYEVKGSGKAGIKLTTIRAVPAIPSETLTSSTMFDLFKNHRTWPKSSSRAGDTSRFSRDVSRVRRFFSAGPSRTKKSRPVSADEEFVPRL